MTRIAHSKRYGSCFFINGCRCGYCGYFCYCRFCCCCCCFVVVIVVVLAEEIIGEFCVPVSVVVVIVVVVVPFVIAVVAIVLSVVHAVRPLL